jgi:hypothetical protein
VNVGEKVAHRHYPRQTGTVVDTWLFPDASRKLMVKLHRKIRADRQITAVWPASELVVLADQAPCWYVEELMGGHWHRSAVGHMWALEKDARQQCQDLRRRNGGTVYRVTSTVKP